MLHWLILASLATLAYTDCYGLCWLILYWATLASLAYIGYTLGLICLHWFNCLHTFKSDNAVWHMYAGMLHCKKCGVFYAPAFQHTMGVITDYVEVV